MPRTNSESDSEGHSLTPEPGKEDFSAATRSPTFFAGEQRSGEHAIVLSNRLARIKTHSKKSLRHPQIPTSALAYISPKDRFRAAVRKVVSLRRGVALPGAVRRVGAEPGVDPRRPESDATYGHLRTQCEIEVVDYSAVRRASKKYTNIEFTQFLDPDSTGSVKRDSWVKVRWINIGGISWDVLKALAIKYQLHPLALEDIVKGNPRTRSKADYYMQHLFMRVMCHQLGQAELENIRPLNHVSSAPFEVRDEDISKGEINRSEFAYGQREAGLLPTYTHRKTSNEGTSSLAKLLVKEKEEMAQQVVSRKVEASLHVVKESNRVAVDVSTMYLFLFRDGTVISIHPTPSLTFTSPVTARLIGIDTILRKSADPSLLVHALLDLTVDRALAVIDCYHQKITKYELEILSRPKMRTVKLLHILSGDLILHKRTLEPVKTMVYGLRRYDLDRCAALIDATDPKNKDQQIAGFMSHKAKIYLADVYDHTEYILASMDTFANIAENLISYTFNMASYEMNEIMRRLTLATIIFLPLTALTGYFGMNFTRMWSINNRSDVFFWELAIPLVAFTIVIATLPDIKKLWEYFSTRRETKKYLQDNFGTKNGLI